LVALLISLSACAPADLPLLSDDPQRYIYDVDYRRGILERDLTARDNEYAEARLELYAIEGEGWDALPERDPLARPLRVSELEGLQSGEPFKMADGEGERLTPDTLPSSDEQWVALGRRVFFEYPFRADPVYETIARMPNALTEVGFLAAGDSVVGMAVFLDESGKARLGPTCAQCHSSADEAGVISPVLANRQMDIGAARLFAMGITPEELPSEIDSTVIADLHRLGPGRTDVLNDGQFNPFAIPDFGGIADFPSLQHNANWVNRGVATLAVRCETLFITASGEQARIPRSLSWALAMYLRSLPPPSPLDAVPEAEAERGEEVFASEGCVSCHAPPLFTSDRKVTIEEVGTDPAALSSVSRGTGQVRIPSLRGVGRTAPYFHHGAIADLETLFDPEREEQGHSFGLSLPAADRSALIAFLRSI